MKRVITEEVVITEFKAGRRRIDARSVNAIVTPGAWSKARELGVGIDKDGDVFVRVDLSIRVLDKDEMTVNVDQVAATADEVFKGLKPNLAVAK